ncbi:MAG TPA: hypothetical protein VJU78_07610, partial [Chitinophagaceae bacterium]|nr:hypothetical protein [Chitinophagaceae bacterium]
MKKFVWFLILPLIVAIFAGCKKNGCEPKPPGSELSQIQAYATANGLNVTAHPSGLYYEIVDTGSGPKANSGSKISITYTGKLMNGEVFDQKLTPNVALWP